MDRGTFGVVLPTSSCQEEGRRAWLMIWEEDVELGCGRVVLKHKR